MIYLDIETKPGDPYLVPESIEAKTGNMVDAAKIEAKNEAEREKYLDRAALKWVIGEVLCVCLLKDEDANPTTFVDVTEGLLLSKLAEHLTPTLSKAVAQAEHNKLGTAEAGNVTTTDITAALSTPQFCTFNGIEFDLPFLVGRFWSHGIDCPTSLLDARFQKRWDTKFHIDLMYWMNDQWMRQGSMMSLWKGANTLDSWCIRAGINIPDPSGIDGSGVPEIWAKFADGELPEDEMLAAVSGHCETDVLKLRELHKSVKNHMLPPVFERVFNYD